MLWHTLTHEDNATLSLRSSHLSSTLQKKGASDSFSCRFRGCSTRVLYDVMHFKCVFQDQFILLHSWASVETGSLNYKVNVLYFPHFFWWVQVRLNCNISLEVDDIPFKTELKKALLFERFETGCPRQDANAGRTPDSTYSATAYTFTLTNATFFSRTPA